MAKILINAVGALMGGSRRHLTGFLPALSQAAGGREYTVLVRPGMLQGQSWPGVRIEVLPEKMDLNAASRLAFESVSLPMKLKRERFDAIVSLTNTGPVFAGVPHVLFQRNSLYFCDAYMSNARGRRLMEARLRRSLAVATMKRASVVVTPSQAMADMITQSCPRLRDKSFAVLHHGYEQQTMTQPLSAGIAEITRKGGGLRLIYPAHPAPHKGFPILFEALAMLRRRGIQTALYATVAFEDWPQEVSTYLERIRDLGLQDTVFFLGRVPQEQMGGVYAAGDVMVYPSLCESFGFPMLEGMDHGVPIVAAGTQISRELCGEAALYYDANDASGLARAIEATTDPSLRAELATKGRQRMRASDRSWTAYAARFNAIVDGVLKQ